MGMAASALSDAFTMSWRWWSPFLSMRRHQWRESNSLETGEHFSSDALEHQTLNHHTDSYNLISKSGLSLPLSVQVSFFFVARDTWQSLSMERCVRVGGFHAEVPCVKNQILPLPVSKRRFSARNPSSTPTHSWIRVQFTGPAPLAAPPPITREKKSSLAPIGRSACHSAAQPAEVLRNSWNSIVYCQPIKSWEFFGLGPNPLL